MNPEKQRERLIAFLKYATNPADGQCNFGAMLILEQPGDVVFANPVAPELRGVEIVSMKDNNYDIWKKGRPLKFNLSRPELVEWLRSRCSHTEGDYKRNIAKWTEDTCRYYNLPRQA